MAHFVPEGADPTLKTRLRSSPCGLGRLRCPEYPTPPCRRRVGRKVCTVASSPGKQSRRAVPSQPGRRGRQGRIAARPSRRAGSLPCHAMPCRRAGRQVERPAFDRQSARHSTGRARHGQVTEHGTRVALAHSPDPLPSHREPSHPEGPRLARPDNPLSRRGAVRGGADQGRNLGCCFGPWSPRAPRPPRPKV